ncbi:MAG: hypothetical protein IJY42_01385, partial [Clostridia bacterium]|nr:hypothetical protein [Clostridia bacterium]
MKKRNLLFKWMAMALLLCTLLTACTTGGTGDGETTTIDPNNGGGETTAPPVEPAGALPTKTANKSITAGDGMVVSKYDNLSEEDFAAACLYFETRGYETYCKRETEQTMSATYLKD